jgi:hypothetical protein
MTRNAAKSPRRHFGKTRAGLRCAGGSRSLLRAAEFYKRAAYDAQNDRFTSSMALKKRTGKYESRFRELVLGVMD